MNTDEFYNTLRMAIGLGAVVVLFLGMSLADAWGERARSRETQPQPEPSRERWSVQYFTDGLSSYPGQVLGVVASRGDAISLAFAHLHERGHGSLGAPERINHGGDSVLDAWQMEHLLPDGKRGGEMLLLRLGAP